MVMWGVLCQFSDKTMQRSMMFFDAMIALITDGAEDKYRNLFAGVLIRIVSRPGRSP